MLVHVGSGQVRRQHEGGQPHVLEPQIVVAERVVNASGDAPAGAQCHGRQGEVDQRPAFDQQPAGHRLGVVGVPAAGDGQSEDRPRTDPGDHIDGHPGLGQRPIGTDVGQTAGASAAQDQCDLGSGQTAHQSGEVRRVAGPHVVVSDRADLGQPAMGAPRAVDLGGVHEHQFSGRRSFGQPQTRSPTAARRSCSPPGAPGRRVRPPRRWRRHPAQGRAARHRGRARRWSLRRCRHRSALHGGRRRDGRRGRRRRQCLNDAADERVLPGDHGDDPAVRRRGTAPAFT